MVEKNIDIEIELRRQLSDINCYSHVWWKYSLLEIEWEYKLICLFPINSWFFWEKICEIESEIIGEKELIKRERNNPELMAFTRFVWKWKYITWIWWAWLWVRHSCYPNALLKIEQNDEWEYTMILQSKKEIREFEEITIDYWAEWNWLSSLEKEIECNCLSKFCRWTKNFYWKTEYDVNIMQTENWIEAFEELDSWTVIWNIWWRKMKNAKEFNKRKKEWITNIQWFYIRWKLFCSDYQTNELAYMKIWNKKESNCYIKKRKDFLEIITYKSISDRERLILLDNWELIFDE